MDLWEFFQNNTIPVLSVIVGAIGAYFGARSYLLAEEQKQSEEIARIKEILVGSSEVSVQNLTEVIETLRSRVDRLEDDRDRIRSLLDSERNRVKRLTEERDRLIEDVKEGETTISEMNDQIQDLEDQLREAQNEIERLTGKLKHTREKRALIIEEAESPEWVDPPFEG